MARITRTNLDRPDEVREQGSLTLHLVRVGGLVVGRGTLPPGWRWSTHMRAATDEPLCTIHHTQLLLSGRVAIQMDDGEYIEIEPNDIFDVPPGHDIWVLGDEPVEILDFLGNVEDLGKQREQDRVVTTLLMTDIVDSTATAGRLGDSAWRHLLTDHNRAVRRRLERYRGEEVNTTGDGFLAMFPSALAAVRCAASITEATREVGVEVRVGVHTGEVEILPDDIGGVAVHACARIMSLGDASEVMVSSTTRSLIEGSDDLHLIDRGSHELKGLDQPVQVYQLET